MPGSKKIPGWEVRPVCDKCDMTTRLVGIEAHPRMIQTDVRTYFCDNCDTSTAFVVPGREPSHPVEGTPDGFGRQFESWN
jgi:hypothetical protein